jgi:hypothetical protein
MTKAEMEEHWRRYTAFIRHARDAEKQAEFSRVVGHAEASREHIDGMLRHASKEHGATELELDGIALVLRYAPVLFDYEALGRLEQFLAGKRRITNSSSSDLADDLADAHAFMRRARVVWDELERRRHWPINTLRQKFSGNEDEWCHIIGTWKSMNTVLALSANGVAYVTLATRMDDAIVAKCPHCGTHSRRTKSGLLAPSHCDTCRRPGVFVHIADAQLAEH